MTPDLVELLVGEPARLVEDLVRHRQLAHVVQQAAERELAQTPLRQAEPLANRDRERGDPAGVALGRRVLLAQPDEQRADAAAEEGLLVLD